MRKLTRPAALFSSSQLRANVPSLDLFEDFLHFLFRVFRDDARAYHVVAVLSRIGAGLTHLREAALVAGSTMSFISWKHSKYAISGG